MKYASNNIRNILIAGHAGSGKTTLTEALVYFSGAAERMGRVEDGTTISDFDPEEAKRKASLSASVVPVEYEGIKYNLIDAPGLFDFEAGEYEGIRAAESVLVVVSGRSGVTVGAEKAFQLARKNNKATMVFVSKCDLENANYFKILEDMKIKFGSTVCPCVVPAKLDDGTPVYINLFSQKAFKYEGGKQIQVDLPDIGHRFQGLIEAMSEAIAETDDELMEKFFGGEPFTTEEIVEGMRKGVKDGLITPVFCGSAVNQQALDMLLFNMHKLLPSPEHEASTLAEDANGEPVELHCTVDEPTAAYVFKTVADPFVGKLSYLRVVSGKVTAGEPLTNARTGDVEKISKPLTVIGKKQVDADGIGAGDIGAVAKLVTARTGDTLCDASRVVKLPAPVFPQPSLFMAVTVAKKGDEGKISSALARLMEEDPTLSYQNNAETHQQVIGGLGEQHLDVVKAKLKNKFGVEIGLEAPRIAYRESIRKACQKQGRHKKQTGGHGQFGDVVINFEPCDSEQVVFEEKVFGGSVPKNFFPAVEKGVRLAESHPAGRQLPPRRQFRNGLYHGRQAGLQGRHAGSRPGHSGAHPHPEGPCAGRQHWRHHGRCDQAARPRAGHGARRRRPADHHRRSAAGRACKLYHLHPADHPGPRLVHHRVRPLRDSARDAGARRGGAGQEAGQPGRSR